MDRSGLINMVKIKLDEYTPEGVTLPFDEYISPLLDESARDIILNAPLYLFIPTPIPISAEVIKYENDKAYIPVPVDYMRLYSVKFPLWKKSITLAIQKENPDYRIQENEYTASGYARPFVAIVYKTISENTSRYFECGKVLINATPVEAYYLKSQKPEDLPDIFNESVTYLCSSKIFLVLGQLDKAKLLNDQFVNAINSI